ncbi:hypothetical protein [Schaedlerella arabinosiphila]|uniref:hypothetical protein n=1 Tax=Schaedlerella arabinosiphila TaxID=2044587 RepID=UPI00039E99D2|nr:hypothetical protein [Schaedlerella arabinosiphila]
MKTDLLLFLRFRLAFLKFLCNKARSRKKNIFVWFGSFAFGGTKIVNPLNEVAKTGIL